MAGDTANSSRLSSLLTPDEFASVAETVQQKLDGLLEIKETEFDRLKAQLERERGNSGKLLDTSIRYDKLHTWSPLTKYWYPVRCPVTCALCNVSPLYSVIELLCLSFYVNQWRGGGVYSSRKSNFFANRATLLPIPSNVRLSALNSASRIHTWHGPLYLTTKPSIQT